MPVLLLLEDDPLTAAVLRDGLAELGWTVRIESDGLDALRSINASPPDAVLADLVLPGLDGLAVCAQIRLQPFGAALPVIVTSSRTQAAAAALAAGADLFVPKPSSADDIHARFSELLAARSQAAPAPPAQRHDDDDAGSGTVGPGWLPALLRRLWREHYTGSLEVQGSTSPLSVRVYFQQGYPAAARSSDRSTDFGEVLSGLGLADPDRVANAVLENSDRKGQDKNSRTLGESLVAGGILDRPGVERSLREQILRRVVGAATCADGTWRLSPATSIGFAGFDVHPIAMEWRIGAVSDTLPGTGFRASRVAAPACTPELWDLLDPQGALSRIRSLLQDGAPIVDVLAASPEAESLLGLMYAYGILRLTVDPVPTPADEDARQDALAAIVAEYRLLADANHYATLSIAPTATSAEVADAAERSLSTIEAASGGALDGRSRQRLREIQQRIQEAARILGDAALRAIYDARLDSPQQRNELRPHAPSRRPDELAEHGRHLLTCEQPVSAVHYLGLALQTADEDDAEVTALMGAARARACPEDATAGEDLIRRALTLDPRCELALLYLGERLAKRPEGIEEARRCFRAALNANPDFAAARAALRRLDT